VVIEQDRNLAVWTWDIAGEAFGNTPPDEDPDGNGIAFRFDMRFPGQKYDSASGLNYNYFRDYEAQTGRYAQSDPIGLAGGLATYLYANGNPKRYIDPRGQAAIAICATPIGFQACRTVATWTLRKTIVACGIVWTWVMSEGGGDGAGDAGEGAEGTPPEETPPLDGGSQSKPPPDALPINQTPWSGNHQDIKKAAGAGPADNVRVSKDGDVWVQNPDGTWGGGVNVKDVVHGEKPAGRKGKDREEGWKKDRREQWKRR